MNVQIFALILAALPLQAASVRIYVANSDDNKISVIDPATDRVSGEIPVSPNPLVIDANADRSINRLFVQLSNLHGFAVIDWASRKVVERVMLPAAPAGARPLIPETFSHGIAISPDHKTLWVTSLLDNSVSVFSLPQLKRLATIPVGRGPDWMPFTPYGAR